MQIGMKRRSRYRACWWSSFFVSTVACTTTLSLGEANAFVPRTFARAQQSKTGYEQRLMGAELAIFAQKEIAEEPLGSEEQLRQQAIQEYQQKRYSQSAVIYEQLWRNYKRPLYLYHLGLARHAMGYHAVAIQAWSDYLAIDPQISADAKAEVKDLIAAAKEQTEAVNLQIQTHTVTAMEATLELSYLPTGANPDASASFEVRTKDEDFTLHLDPGIWVVKVAVPNYEPVEITQRVYRNQPRATWPLVLEPELGKLVHAQFRVEPYEAVKAGVVLRLRPKRAGKQEWSAWSLELSQAELELPSGMWDMVAEAPGYVSLQQDLALVPDQEPISIRLQKREKWRPDHDFKVGLGLWIGGAALLGSGAGVGMMGVQRFENAWLRNIDAFAGADLSLSATPPFSQKQVETVEDAYPTLEYHQDLGKGLSLQGVGTGLLGAGAGIWVAALTKSLGTRKKIVWYSELGVGGALAVGGTIGLILSSRAFGRRTQSSEDTGTWRAHVSDLRPITQQYTAASGILGAGVGMVVGAGIGLLTQVLYEKANQSAKKEQAIRITPYQGRGEWGLMVQQQF